MKNFRSFQLPKFERTQKIKPLFAHKKSDFSAVREKVQVILSPAYYWCRKETMEIRSEYRAVKLAPSVFYGHVAPGNYRYFVRKRGKEFFFFALDEEAVLVSLEQQGLSREWVAAFYFAQDVFGGLTDPVRPDPQVALIIQDGLVAEVPAAYVPEAEPVTPEKLPLGPRKVKVSSFSQGDIPKRAFYPMAASLLVMLAAGTAQWVQAGGETARLEERKANLFSDYGLPPVSLQVESIKRKLRATEKRQQTLRKEMVDLLALKLQEGERFEEFQAGTKGIEALLTLADEKRTAPVAQEIRKRFSGAEISSVENRLQVKIKP